MPRWNHLLELLSRDFAVDTKLTVGDGAARRVALCRGEHRCVEVTVPLIPAAGTVSDAELHRIATALDIPRCLLG